MTLGNLDSAAYYFGLIEDYLPVIEIRDETLAAIYGSLSKLAEQQKSYTKALEYLKKDILYVMKVRNRIEKDGVFRIQQQYDYENLRNKLNDKIINRQHIILLMSMIVVVVFAILLVEQKQLAKTRKQEIDAKERTLFYVRQYTDLLEKQSHVIQQLAIVMDNKGDRASFENLRATVCGEKDPWEALMDVFDTLYPNERETICAQYPNLTEAEKKDVILSRFNVSRQDEALLLKTSVHSIDKIRKNVKIKTHILIEKQKQSS